MNSGSYISVNTIIESLFREYGFNPTDIDEETILELVYSGMRLIGAPVFVDRAETLTVSNYRTAVPSDCLYPLAIRLEKTMTILNQSTDLWSFCWWNCTGFTSRLSSRNQHQLLSC
jgi:hypothetical protein